MQLNPTASNALKESQIHHIFQGLNEHKFLPSHPNYQNSTLSIETFIKTRTMVYADCPRRTSTTRIGLNARKFSVLIFHTKMSYSAMIFTIFWMKIFVGMKNRDLGSVILPLISAAVIPTPIVFIFFVIIFSQIM